ncbi:hypothetical protein GCM10010840_00130 [Deinococcus aerolatus]|uniref:Lipoprotein n=1 Tax=Deinococcus aerolatus TaxID=522487 RepID=A0ABQ2FYI2_9DEIO|nr:hypothetical protein [Deinococcus aerolatus]GGL66183.1 hypothetical protein GCM10010840_00130 [Deinococcus aerolatus]
MRRLLTLVPRLLILGLLPLAGCAPVPAGAPAQSQVASPKVVAAPADPGFRAAFAPEGVAWVSGGQACVARMPSYRVTCPRLPPVVDVAWNAGDAWAAVPGLGAVVTLDRAARTVAVGRVVALSASRAYREDGTAVTYAGAATRGVVGAPAAALTGGDGQDYVLLGGRLLRVSDGAVLETGAGPYLHATPTGARSADVPGVNGAFGRYRLNNGALERLDTAGGVLARVPHGPGRVGLVGTDVVTISPQGQVRVFGTDLRER